MRLYLFQCGILKSWKHLFTMGRGIGVLFQVPVPFFLIDHPKGKRLFDTGNALAVARDKVRHWGQDGVAAYDPVMTEDDYAVAQLARLGIAAAEITHVVFSHLHLDHAGATGEFVNAVHYVQRARRRRFDPENAGLAAAPRRPRHHRSRSRGLGELRQSSRLL